MYLDCHVVLVRQVRLFGYMIAYHELLVEVGTQHVVDELLFLVAVLCASCLVLEHHVVVPSALHCKVFSVKQRVASRDVNFALLLLFCGAFGFFLDFGYCALLFDLFEFAHKGCGFVFFVFVTRRLLAACTKPTPSMDVLIIAAVALTTAVVCIHLSKLFEHFYAPPLLRRFIFFALFCP